jgi:ribosomal protein S18 acetylase RimI-like enzyme
MEGEVAAAYAGILTVLDEGQITNVATAPAYRQRGLAAKALGAVLQHARERALGSVTLEVRVSNAPAIALYEKYGFTVLGRRKGFYTLPT